MKNQEILVCAEYAKAKLEILDKIIDFMKAEKVEWVRCYRDGEIWFSLNDIQAIIKIDSSWSSPCKIILNFVLADYEDCYGHFIFDGALHVSMLDFKELNPFIEFMQKIREYLIGVF